jgi:hypothetical protein
MIAGDFAALRFGNLFRSLPGARGCVILGSLSGTGSLVMGWQRLASQQLTDPAS